MRTLGKTLEYLALVGMVGTAIYLGMTPVAHQIGDSLNESADMIAHPQEFVRNH